MGLFLSYPPEDVKGFIDHRASGFKCAGLWKVYGDEEKARSLFEKYRKCTEIYCALWQSGLKLEQHAWVAVAKQPIRKGRDTLRCPCLALYGDAWSVEKNMRKHPRQANRESLH